MKKYDWLHFIIFINVFIYFEWSRRVLFGDSDGRNQGLYANLYLLKAVVWSAYGIAQTRVIFKYKKESTDGTYDVRTFKWIKTYNFIIILLFSSIMVMKFLRLDLNSSFMNEILTSLALTAIIIQLIFKPQILYGFDSSASDHVISTLRGSRCCRVQNQACSYQMFDDDKKEFYLQKLADLMHSVKPFLRKGYMIKELAEEVNIPLHHLSHLINRELNVHYQDYMNQQRIEYLKDKFNEPEWQQLSLEGMAWQVGFSSRTTFFRAFIKFTGQPPSKYFSIELENRKAE